MKKINVFSFFLIISLLFFACQPVSIPDSEKGVLVALELTTIKAEPNFSASDVATVKKNTQFALVGTLGEWYEIQLPNRTQGWIHRSLVKMKTFKMGRIDDQIELRWRANDSSPVSQVVQGGSQVKILQETDEWFLLQPVSNDNYGWVTRGELFKAGFRYGSQPGTPSTDYAPYYEQNVLMYTTSGANIRPDPSTNNQPITKVNSKTALGWQATVGSWYLVSITKTGESGYIYKPLASREPYETIKNNQDCNLRAGPSINSLKIDRIQPNTNLIVLNDHRDWYLIEKPDGNLAWIRSDLTTQPIDGSGEYSVSTGKRYFGFYYANQVTNVREKASDFSRSIALLNAGDRISITKFSQFSDWHQVKVKNKRQGYVAAQNVVGVARKVLITRAKVDVRENPGKNASSLGQLSPGMFLYLRKVQPGWCEINTTQGLQGWVSSEYVIPRMFRSIFVKKEESSYHADSKTTSAPLGYLSKGEELYFIRKDKKWYQYKALDSDATVWINRTNVTVPKYGYGITTQSGAVYEGPNINFPKLAELLEINTVVPILDKRLSMYQIMVPDRKKMGYVQAGIIKSCSMRPLIAIERAELYTQSTSKSSTRKTLPPGTEIYELKRTGKWRQIWMPDTAEPVQWVHSQSVAPMKDGTFRTGRKSTLRYGPGTEYKELRTIPSRTTVTIIAFQDKWYQVEYAGLVGWMVK